MYNLGINYVILYILSVLVAHWTPIYLYMLLLLLASYVTKKYSTLKIHMKRKSSVNLPILSDSATYSDAVSTYRNISGFFLAGSMAKHSSAWDMESLTSCIE